MELKRIIFEVFYRVWTARGVFAKALVTPFAVEVGLDLLKPAQPPIAEHIILTILGLIVYSWLAITVHRLVLLGPHSVPEWGLQRITKREVLFIVSIVLVSVIAASPFLLLMVLPGAALLFALAILLLYAYLFSRFSLVFPAIAVDGWATPLDSWRLTQRHQLKLVFVVILFPLILAVPLLPISLLPDYLAKVLRSLTSTMVLVLTVAALSIVYREIRRMETSDAS